MSEVLDGIAEFVENLRNMAPPRSAPFPDAAHIYEVAADIIEELSKEVDRCHERLEIDRVYVAGYGEELVRKAVPVEDRHDYPDGIECRDTTISLLEDSLLASQARLSEAVKVLEALIERYEEIVTHDDVGRSLKDHDLS